MARANAERIVGLLLHETGERPFLLTPDMRCPDGIGRADADPDPCARTGPMPRGPQAGGAGEGGARRSASEGGIADALDAAEARVRAALKGDGTDATDAIVDIAWAHRLMRRRGGALALVVCAAAAVVWPVAAGLAVGLVLGVVLAGAVLLRVVVANGRWQRLAARRPRQAEALRSVADPLAEWLDRGLDLLPDSWAEALALPDLSRPGPAGNGRG